MSNGDATKNALITNVPTAEEQSLAGHLGIVSSGQPSGAGNIFARISQPSGAVKTYYTGLSQPSAVRSTFTGIPNAASLVVSNEASPHPAAGSLTTVAGMTGTAMPTPTVPTVAVLPPQVGATAPPTIPTAAVMPLQVAVTAPSIAAHVTPQQTAPPTMVIPEMPTMHLTGMTANAALQSAVEQAPVPVTHAAQPIPVIPATIPSAIPPMATAPASADELRSMFENPRFVELLKELERQAQAESARATELARTPSAPGQIGVMGKTMGQMRVSYDNMEPFADSLPNYGMSGMMDGQATPSLGTEDLALGLATAIDRIEAIPGHLPPPPIDCRKLIRRLWVLLLRVLAELLNLSADDYDVRERASKFLGQLGWDPVVILLLLAAFNGSDPEVRMRVSHILMFLLGKLDEDIKWYLDKIERLRKIEDDPNSLPGARSAARDEIPRVLDGLAEEIREKYPKLVDVFERWRAHGAPVVQPGGE